jgi:ABC-type molybdate transport system permease subunit
MPVTSTRKVEVAKNGSVLEFFLDGKKLRVTWDEKVVQQALKSHALYPQMVKQMLLMIQRKLEDATPTPTATEVQAFMKLVQAEIEELK